MGAAAKAGGKAAKKAQQKAVKLETKKKVGRRAIAAHGAFGAGRVGVGLPSVSRHRRCAQVEETSEEESEEEESEEESDEPSKVRLRQRRQPAPRSAGCRGSGTRRKPALRRACRI